MPFDELIDLGGDAPDDFGVSSRQKQFRVGVIEPRVPDGIDQAINFGFERRDPVRVVRIYLPRQFYEFTPIRFAANRPNGNCCTHQTISGALAPTRVTSHDAA